LRIALRGKAVGMTERRWIRNSQMLALLLKYFAHDRQWPQLIRMYPPYKGYPDAIARVIPLVVCEQSG